jgi:hypothetical protein
MIPGQAWGERCFGDFSGDGFDSGRMTLSSSLLRAMLALSLFDCGEVDVWEDERAVSKVRRVRMVRATTIFFRKTCTCGWIDLEEQTAI